MSEDQKFLTVIVICITVIVCFRLYRDTYLNGHCKCPHCTGKTK